MSKNSNKYRALKLNIYMPRKGVDVLEKRRELHGKTQKIRIK